MRFGNERGVALVLVVLTAIAVIIAFSATLSSMVESTGTNLSREQQQIAGRTALRDFAIMAENANRAWVTRVGPNCPAGTTRGPTAASNFCWPNDNPNNTHCIRHPLVSTAANVFLCLRAAGNPLNLALETVDKRPWHEKLLNQTSELIAKLQNMVIDEVSNAVHAQLAEIYRPVLVVPANILITMQQPANLTCTAATAGNLTYCKRCGAGPPLPNVECVELQVCVKFSGACLANEYVRQTVGIMTR